VGEWDDAILVGVVARTHGNRGEVIVNPETDFPEDRFAPGARLMARDRGGVLGTVEIASMRMHQGRPVVAIAGVESMNAAEALAGLELRVPPGEAQQELPRGSYYHRDLVGCEVVTPEGQPVGRVTSVEGQGQSRLVVAGPRGDVLIPLADAICTVDVVARRITVTPPEGLLELNGDGR